MSAVERMFVKMIGCINGILEKQRYGELYSTINTENYQEFLSESDCSNWADTLYSKWAKAYSGIFAGTHLYSAYSILRLSDPADYYFGFGYERINNYLRNGQKMPPRDFLINYPEDHLKLKIALLTAAIYSTPKTDRDLILYRQVCREMIEEMIQRNKTKGIPYCEYGFMSTSLVKSACVSNCGDYEDMLKIYAPQGLHGIYANLIRSRGEAEFVLPPEMFLKMIRAPYIDEDSGKTVYEVQLINFHVM